MEKFLENELLSCLVLLSNPAQQLTDLCHCPDCADKSGTPASSSRQLHGGGTERLTISFWSLQATGIFPIRNRGVQFGFKLTNHNPHSRPRFLVNWSFPFASRRAQLETSEREVFPMETIHGWSQILLCRLLTMTGCIFDCLIKQYFSPLSTILPSSRINDIPLHVTVKKMHHHPR